MSPNLSEFKLFCLFDFAPFPEYVEEIYQTYKEAESSKFLDVAAASMNCMLEKEDRKVAMERRQAKQLIVATILTFCSCSLGHLTGQEGLI